MTPILNSPIPDSVAKAGDAYSFTVGSSFKDLDLDDKLSLSATLEQGQPLPAWLKFDSTTGSFSGKPAQADAGQLTIKLTATDQAGAAVSDLFNLTVAKASESGRCQGISEPAAKASEPSIRLADPQTGQPTPVIQMNQTIDLQQQGNAKGNLLKGGWLTNDLLRGGNGDDVLIGGIGRAKAGRDRLYGGGGNDRLYGGGGNDLLDGGDGNDKAWGGNGRDLLLGGSGNDRLLGQADDDILNGGLGDDWLVGGQGKDMFVFDRPNAGRDTIADFELDQDVIDLRQIFTAPEFAGQSGLSRFRQFVQLEQVGANTDVKLNLDGSGFKTLATLQNTSVSAVKPSHFVML